MSHSWVSFSKGLFDVILASPESLLCHYKNCLNKALKAIFEDEAHCIKKLLVETLLFSAGRLVSPVCNSG